MQPLRQALLRRQIPTYRINILKNTPKNLKREQPPVRLSLLRRVRCSFNHFYGSTRRIMRSYLIGAHRAVALCAPVLIVWLVVSSRYHHKNYLLSHTIQPLRASSTPSSTAQPFRTDHGVLCSVP